MSVKIRRALLEDTHRFLFIKEQLSFTKVDGSTTTGGFLLGTDLASYQAYITNDYCLVAEKNGLVIGFAIVINNDHLKQTDLWTKRHLAQWDIDIESFVKESVCYFEQLAFLYGYSRSVMEICLKMMEWILTTHDYLFTTTVHSPILNLAAVPYILRAGGQKIGTIDEHYPIIGYIKSDIYKIDKFIYQERLAQADWVPKLLKRH